MAIAREGDGPSCCVSCRQQLAKRGTRCCVVCGASLEGRRRHAVTCGGDCRAERSRLLRILLGWGADGRASVSDEYERRRSLGA